MSENIQTQFHQEGQKLFDENTEKDNSADSSSVEETNTNQTQSQEGDQNSGANKKDDGDAGLADHPRWQERENDWKTRFNDQETRHTSEISALREEITKQLSGSDNKNSAGKQDAEIPEWFGGDESAWAKYSEHTQNLVNTAVEQALKQVGAKSEQEQKAIDVATTYFNEQVTLLETDKSMNPQGEKVDRNKLLKFVLDNDLVDSKGRWNYKAGYQMMRSIKTNAQVDKTKDKKNLANATTSDNKPETKQPNVMTSSDFKQPGARPW